MIWDATTAQAIASMPSPPEREFPFLKGSGHQDSIYCLATNRYAQVSKET
jgi:hypothetical protein